MAYKFLTADAFNALSKKAEQHDKIVEALNAARADDYDKELTAAEAVEMLLNPENRETAALQSQIEQLTGTNTTLQGSIDSLTTERDTLQTRVEELEHLVPGATTATLNADGEPIGDQGGSDLLSFAKEHTGDPMAIVAKMKEDGIL